MLMNPCRPSLATWRACACGRTSSSSADSIVLALVPRPEAPMLLINSCFGFLQAIAGHVESLRAWTYQQQLC
jgi:hypothetical protein